MQNQQPKLTHKFKLTILILLSFNILFLHSPHIHAQETCTTTNCDDKKKNLDQKNNYSQEIVKKLDANKVAKQEAEAKKESSLVIKLNLNIAMGNIKKQTLDEEIILLQTEIKKCEGEACNGK
jgi:hypothetical protein